MEAKPSKEELIKEMDKNEAKATHPTYEQVVNYAKQLESTIQKIQQDVSFKRLDYLFEMTDKAEKFLSDKELKELVSLEIKQALYPEGYEAAKERLSKVIELPKSE